MRWLRRFFRWYAASIQSGPLPTISFDTERVRILKASGEDVGFPWAAVRRIGYRTISSWGDDYFLEIHLVDGQVLWIAVYWPGAEALCRHVDRLPDTRIDPVRGVLANVTDNDSIIVWPSREAGGSMDDPFSG